MPDAFGRPDQTGQTVRLGIPYSEYMNDSPKESFAPDQSSASRVFDVDPSRVSDFIAAMLGDVSIENKDGALHRDLPEAHPRYPWMYVSSIERSENMGKANIVPTPSGQPETQHILSRFRVTYTPRLYNIQDDAYVTASPLQELTRYCEFRGPKISHEAYPLPATSFQWAEGSLTGNPVQEPAGKVFPLGSLEIIWYDLPTPIDCGGFVGCVNDGQLNLNTGYASETLLFMSGDNIRKPTSPTGRKLWDLHISLMWRPNTWNRLYCKTDNAFRRVVLRDGTTPPYVLATFQNLFSNVGWVAAEPDA